MRQLRVAVVGCSGTGSIVVEQLARLGVGHLILVDPDVVEYKNLNRILNSTNEDAALRRSKVEVMARAIARMGLGTTVELHQANLLAPAGTGGTISGVGRRLKAALPRVRVILADPVGSGLADWVETGRIGPDGAYAVEGIGGSEAPENLHRDVIDGAERVSDAESFAMVTRLVREEGLLVGGSAGTNVAAALRVAARGGLEGPVVTLLPDGWDRYRAKPWMQDWPRSQRTP